MVFNTMKQGVVHQARDGTIILANRAAEEILGISLEKMSKMTSDNPQWKTINEDGTPLPGSDHPSMKALTTGEEVQDFVMGVYNPLKKKMIWIELDAIPLFQECENEPFEVYTVFEDITEKREMEEAFRRNEIKFTRMANSVNDIFWTMDMEMDFTYVSPSIERLTGFTPEDFLEIGVEGIVAEEYVSTLMEQVIEGISDEARGEFPRDGFRRTEFIMNRKDGGKIWVEAIGSFLRDDEGNPVEIMGVTRDISHKKKFENELKESEAKYRHLFESAGDAIMITVRTPEGPRFIACNQKAGELFGTDKDGLLGADPTMLSPPKQPDGTDSYEIILKNMRKVIEGKTVHLEWVHRRVDGTDFPCEVTLSRINLGDEIAIQAIIRDITERKKAEDEAKKIHEELDFYFNSSLDLLCIADIDGYFRRLNPEWENTLGYDIKELEGRKFLDFVHPDDLQSTIDAVSKLRKSESVLNFENRYRCSDGSYRWIEWRSLPEGNLIYAVARDITERKEDADRMRVLTELLDSAPAAITVHNFDGNFLYTNRRNLELHGMDHGEFLNKKLEEIDNPASRKLIAQRMDQIKRKGEASFEVEHLKKDGSVIPLSVVTKLTKWGYNDVLLSIGTDITEKKKAEEALRQSEERYRVLVENANETILVAQDNVIKFINPIGTSITGFPVDEMIGQPFIQFIHPEDKKKVAESHIRRIKGEVIPKYNFRTVSRDGSIHWMEIDAVKIEWEGRPATLNFLSEVTEKKIAEDELKKSEEWYRALIEISPDPILIYDLNGNIKSANSQAKSMYGVETTEEFLSEVINIGDLLEGEDKEKAFRNFERTLKEGRSTATEYSIRIKDGSMILIEVASSVLCDTNGKPISFISIIRDITEQRKSRDLIEWERNRAEFYLDLLSHDIGNIHQGLQAWTAILKARSSQESERLRSIAKLEELGKRSIKLVKNVLLLSRLKDMGADLAPVNIIPLIKKTIKDIRSLFADREMEINISSSTKEAIVMSEPVIEEVFFNLLHNGVKFQYEDPIRIDISIHVEEDGSVRVSFADHGIGVSDDKKGRLFDRHIKGSDYGYSGIGLSLVKELVMRYNGTLEVKDRIPGDYSKGAEFVIFFPPRGKDC